jgi:hypothetical protein
LLLLMPPPGIVFLPPPGMMNLTPLRKILFVGGEGGGGDSLEDNELRKSLDGIYAESRAWLRGEDPGGAVKK